MRGYSTSSSTYQGKMLHMSAAILMYHRVASLTQDVHNLAWKLAGVLHGWATPEILDAYEAERQPITDQASRIISDIGYQRMMQGNELSPEIERLDEIGEAARAELVLRRKIERGERLMGFGHRVYKVRDPRADVLAAAAERMFAGAGDMRLYELARSVEATALRLLEEYKPDRRLQTNVEFYTALLLHGLGIDVPFFTPTFAIGRVAGWTAHCFEQRAVGRLIRPQSAYVGRIPA